MEEKIEKNIHSIHFIGIGGISLSSLAKYYLLQGCSVSGSDLCENEETQALRSLGAKITIGHDATKIHRKEVVVYTDAVRADNPERVAALQAGIKCISRMECLASITEHFGRIITIGGSHGKTSATAMCAHVLQVGGQKFTAHIGGRDATFDNFYSCGKEIFLSEACEYQKNLLRFPRITTSVLLNCDRDHLECYRDYDELRSTFQTYLNKGEISVFNADAGACCPAGEVSFGMENPKSDYFASDIAQEGQKYSFTVKKHGKKYARVSLSVCGKFQIYNALACFAATDCNGVDAEDIVAGLASFRGVLRRFERIGRMGDKECICDYAHHPTEIVKTVETAQKMVGKNLIVVFQPHTYSRTRLLKEEFIAALSASENVVIYKTYPAREEYDALGDARRLAEGVKKSLYADSKEELMEILRSYTGAYTVLFLGAGDVYSLAKDLCKS